MQNVDSDGGRAETKMCRSQFRRQVRFLNAEMTGEQNKQEAQLKLSENQG